MITERKRIFCEEYLRSHNATEAAKKAGYSAKTAYSSGSRLLKDVDVKKYLEAVKQEAHSERIATANEVLEYLSDTMRATHEPRKERTKAAELLGKVHHIFDSEGEENPDKDLEITVRVIDCSGGADE